MHRAQRRDKKEKELIKWQNPIKKLVWILT